MESRRLVGRLVSLVVLLCLAPGCQVLHVYRPVSVLVRDAETKKPVAGAQVQLEYPTTHDSLAPFASSGLTGDDGIARLRAAPFGYALLITATASGYLAENQELPVATVQKIQPSSWFEAAERRPTSFIVDMYAQPAFSVELVLPSGYRGLVRAQVQTAEGTSFPAGQRCFRFDVPASGVVQVSGPAPLGRLSAPDFRARFEGGPLLGEKMDVVTTGFRWLTREGNDHLFVVGTINDYEVFRRRYAPRDSSGGSSHSSPEDSGEKHGGGGHHRGGSGSNGN
jgi:hypothetical protein